ncbi:MAG: Asp23/Gls24 family envelope stress response protein [Anaerolineae bacterium]|nr:Asp23/Gls24 family envelope stress response protein [Anaerolineae bacterium]
MIQQTALGTVEMSRKAVASLVTHAALRSYGVVGMTTPTRASGLAATITRDPHRGVNVQIDAENHLTIDLYIIVEHGTNIASVATSLISAVRYQVQTQTGLRVAQINVHVQDLRHSSPQRMF